MKRKNILRIIAISVAITFILIGLLRDEHLMVLSKAVSICLECIGIG